MVSFKTYQKVPLNSSNFFNECWIDSDVALNMSAVPSMKADFWLHEPDSIIAASMFAAQSCFGIIMNIMIIVATLRSPGLRKGYLAPSIISIAATDLIFSIVVCCGSSIYFFIRDMPLPNGCQAYSLVFYVLWMCSGLNLLGIATLRCLLVHFPRKMNDPNFQLASKVIPIMAWAVSIVWLLPTAIGKYGQFGLDCKMLTCRFIEQDVDGYEANPEKTYFLGIVLIGFILLVLNLLTYKRLSSHNRKMLSNIPSVEEENTKRTLARERKVGKMVATITMLFFITYLPVDIMCIIEHDIMTTRPKLFIIAALFAGSIGIIDPLVYVAFNRQYRDEVKSLINDVSFSYSVVSKSRVKTDAIT